jgi:hypothetical protein
MIPPAARHEHAASVVSKGQQQVVISNEEEKAITEPVRRRWSRRFLDLSGSAPDFPYPEEPPPAEPGPGLSADCARQAERAMADLDVRPDVEDAWAAEVERRHQEIERGAVSMLPGPETLAKLKAEFR